MAYFYLVPQWFFGFDIAMEILFAIVAFSVASYSYKMYKISKERNVIHFSLGFLFIGISYVFWAISNILIATEASNGIKLSELSELALIGTIGVYSYIFFFIIGLVSLAYATLRIKDGRVYYLIIGLSLLVIGAGINQLITARILGIFLISFIAYYYLLEYNEYRNKNTRLMLISFIILLLSSTDFIFSMLYYQAYVIGHILELCAYGLILNNLVKAAKKR